MTKSEIVEILKTRFVTREELVEMLETDSDPAARAWMAELKREYPIISTSRRRGYKIAVTEEEIGLVEESIMDRRNRAFALFQTCKQLINFKKSFPVKEGDRSLEQLSFNFDSYGTEQAQNG